MNYIVFGYFINYCFKYKRQTNIELNYKKLSTADMLSKIDYNFSKSKNF